MSHASKPNLSAPVKRRRRIFLPLFLLVQAVFIVWIITGAMSGSGQPTDCGSLTAETCDAAQNAGTAIGVALIVVCWVVVDFLLAVGYVIYRLAKRP